MLGFQYLPRLVQQRIEVFPTLARFLLFTLKPFLLSYVLPLTKKTSSVCDSTTLLSAKENH
jgi:hypothetical protein